MGYQNGVISQPVSIYDVQQCLSTNDNDLATLCMKNNINMWSPHKPIYSTKIGVLTDEDWQGGAHTLSGYKTGGGIKKVAISGTEYLNSVGGDISKPSDVPSAVWVHDKPICDGVCCFRLTDFNGYWHTVGRMFNIGTIYGNINNIIIPSNSSGDGANIGFSMNFNVSTGTIVAHELFGDCWGYYPTVILTCGSSDKLHYAKSADNAISSYTSSTAYITIDTADMANQIASDWLSSHSGDPYSSFPLRTGDKWTACVVLLSRQLDGGSGSGHKLNSTDTVVRLEYANPSNGVCVDRKTLPVKQSKYNNIDWMKMNIRITKQSSGVYKISYIKVTANMLTTDNVTFTIDASLSTPQGNVNVQNTASGQQITVEGYSSATFYGETGEVEKTLGINETVYTVTATTSGNQLCNGTLTFKNSKGNFTGTFSIDISGGGSYYDREVQLL